jgi:hypothetical protein
MGRSSEASSSARGAALRAIKDRLIVHLHGCLDAHELRALVAGGIVFPAHGLISPRLSRSVSLIIAPPDLAPLIGALAAEGWVVDHGHRFLSPLPSAITHLSHHAWETGINVHSIIPGFFVDPEVTFEVLWENRSTIEIGGVAVTALDKLSTVIFAAHDRLAGDRSRPNPESNLEYFLKQFRRALSARECRNLENRVRLVGGGQELRALLEGLGLDPGPIVLPSDEYTMARLHLARATMADCCLLGVLELPADRRWPVIRHKVKWTPAGVGRALRAAVVSFVHVRTAPQRLERAL